MKIVSIFFCSWIILFFTFFVPLPATPFREIVGPTFSTSFDNQTNIKMSILINEEFADASVMILTSPEIATILSHLKAEIDDLKIFEETKRSTSSSRRKIQLVKSCISFWSERKLRMHVDDYIKRMVGFEMKKAQNFKLRLFKVNATELSVKVYNAL